jgi:hypothetical protein
MATRPVIVAAVDVTAQAPGSTIGRVRIEADPPSTAKSETNVRVPPSVKEVPEVVEIKKPAGDPAAQAILEKYVAAVGGKPAFDKFSNRVSTGTVELTALGLKGSVEIVEESPNKSSMIINTPGLGTMQRTFDGTRAWLQDPLQGLIRFHGLSLEMVKDAAVFNKQARLAESYPSAVLIGKEKLAGKDVQVVRLGFERWYFDPETGLLLRRGNTYYDDYREVDGVKLPFKIREEVFSGAAAVYQLSAIKHNVKIDETKFSEYPSCFTKQ